MNITVHITGLEEISSAINSLALAVALRTANTANPAESPATTQTPAPAPNLAPAPTPSVTTAQPNEAPWVDLTPEPSPAPAPTQTPPQAPVAPPATFSLEQLQQAAAGLVDKGKQNEVMALIQQYQVSRMTEIPPQHYGAFAMALRGLGADI